MRIFWLGLTGATVGTLGIAALGGILVHKYITRNIVQPPCPYGRGRYHF